MSAERLEPKGAQSSPECLTLFRRELTGLPVYRADLNPPVLNAEHGKAASLGHDWFVVGPTARQGEQEQHWDDRRSQGRDVMFRICPRRSGLERRESLWNHFYLGIAMDERRLSLGAPGPVALRSAGMKAATEYCQMERWE